MRASLGIVVCSDCYSMTSKKRDGNYLQYSFKHVYRLLLDFFFCRIIDFIRFVRWAYFFRVEILVDFSFIFFYSTSIGNDCDENTLPNQSNWEKRANTLITLSNWLDILNQAVIEALNEGKNYRNLVEISNRKKKANRLIEPKSMRKRARKTERV